MIGSVVPYFRLIDKVTISPLFRRQMKTVTIKNSDGETIEVRRGNIQGAEVILVRHSGKDIDSFGEFNTIQMLANDPKAWEFLAKRGVYTNSEMGEEALRLMGDVGFLRIHGEQLLINAEDGRLICEAIKQLA